MKIKTLLLPILIGCLVFPGIIRAKSEPDIMELHCKELKPITGFQITKADFDQKLSALRTKMNAKEPSNVRKESGSYMQKFEMQNLNLSNAQQVEDVSWNDGYIKLQFLTGNGRNVPTYYDLGKGVRLYNGNQLSITSMIKDISILSVGFAFDEGYSWTTSPTLNSGGEYEVSNNRLLCDKTTPSVLITTNSTVRIQSILVIYTIGNNSGDEYNDLVYLGNGTFKDPNFLGLRNWETDVFSYSSVEDTGNLQFDRSLFFVNPYGCANSPFSYLVGSCPEGCSQDLYVFPIKNHKVKGKTPLLIDMLYSGISYESMMGVGDFAMISYPIFQMLFGDPITGDKIGTFPTEWEKYPVMDKGVIYCPPRTMIAIQFSSEGESISVAFFEDLLNLAAIPGSDISQEYIESDIIYVGGPKETLRDKFSEVKEYKRNSNGSFSFNISNLEGLTISTSCTNYDDFVNNMISCNAVYGSRLGSELSLLNISNTIWMPWKGTYKVDISGDLSTVKFTTSTPRPSSVSLYLKGAFNNWKDETKYKFSRTSSGVYTLTLPQNVSGQWKIGDPNMIYNYGYNGAPNTSNMYEMEYAGRDCTLPLNKGDKLTIRIDEDIYTENPSLIIEKYSEPVEEQPEEPESETFTVNGITYITYPATNVFAVVDGHNAKGNVVLLESKELKGKTFKLSAVNANAFKSNLEITSVKMPESVKTIGDYAFSGCDNLQEVEFSSSLQVIGDYAFEKCTYLSEIKLPSSVTQIGMGVFSGCTDLTSLDFGNSKIISIPVSFVNGCERLVEVSIPNTVNTIGLGAFANTGLTTIGNSQYITSIEDNAFSGSNLKDFKFGKNLTKIGSAAFANTSLSRVTIPNTIKTLNAETFKNCSALAEIILPSSIANIGESAFENCTSLHSITIPHSVTSIGTNAFLNSGIVSIVIPDAVTELGEGSLSSSSLKSITLGTGITSLASQPISTTGMIKLSSTVPPLLSSQRLGCNPAVVIVPKGSGETYKKTNRWKDYNIIEENGEKAIVYLTSPGTLAQEIRMQTGKMPAQITNITIDGELNATDFAVIRSNMTACYDLNLSRITNTEIPANAFENKIILTNLTLSPKITRIGQRAFANCSLLSVSSFPEQLKVIEDEAFYNCATLTESLKVSNCESIGTNAFANCYGIQDINLSLTKLSELSDSLFENVQSLHSIKLPSSLSSIGRNAFRNTGIYDITLPSNIKVIESSAFENCALLSGIEIPDGVEKIGERAFAGTGLAMIDFPESLTTLSDEVLAECPDLMVVNLSSTLKELGNRALASRNISAISSPSSEPAITGINPFDKVNNYSCGLSIPGRSFTAYINAEYWGSFVGIRNNIDVSISGNIEVSYMDEEDYQYIISDKAALSPARAKALQTLKSNRGVSENKGYGRLFNGARLYRGEKSRTRYFFDKPANSRTFKVLYNDVDVTDQIDKTNMSYLAPEFTYDSSLVVIGDQDGVETIVDNIFTDSRIYNVHGICVGKSIENLPAGIYIRNGKKIVVSR